MREERKDFKEIKNEHIQKKKGVEEKLSQKFKFMERRDKIKNKWR